MKKEEIHTYLSNLSDMKKDNSNTKRVEAELQKLRDKIGKEIDDTYFKDMNLSSVDCYKELISNKYSVFDLSAENIFSPEDIDDISALTKKTIDSAYFDEDDVVPIVYLHLRLFGNSAENKNIKHIVIDEAQDMSIFQIAILKGLFNTNSFSIFGDLRQGIFSFKGIIDWAELSKQVFKNKAKYVTLKQSYRTTAEILGSVLILLL